MSTTAKIQQARSVKLYMLCKPFHGYLPCIFGGKINVAIPPDVVEIRIKRPQLDKCQPAEVMLTQAVANNSRMVILILAIAQT